MSRDRIGSAVAEGCTLGVILAWIVAALLSP